MSNDTTHSDEQGLAAMRASLLRWRCPKVISGEEALELHCQLARLLHRASRLYTAGKSETKGWVRYLTDFFPEGRNDPDDAYLLWRDWRCSLLKDEQPVMPISHGQPSAHWQRDIDGRRFLNLENLWADYEYSVERFIEYLRTHPDGRKAALRRWRERAWSVKMVNLSPEEVPVGQWVATTASVASSIAVIRLDPRA